MQARYPIIYCLVILPLSIVRWISFKQEGATGEIHIPPVATFIFSIPLSLSGVLNALLYPLTRAGFFYSAINSKQNGSAVWFFTSLVTFCWGGCGLCQEATGLQVIVITGVFPPHLMINFTCEKCVPFISLSTEWEIACHSHTSKTRSLTLQSYTPNIGVIWSSSQCYNYSQWK